MLRYLTAGESHGKALVVILEGLPAGLEITALQRVGTHVRKTWRVIFWRLVKKVLTRRQYARFLISNLTGDRAFAFTVLRLLAAYHTRAIDYGIISARKP